MLNKEKLRVYSVAIGVLFYKVGTNKCKISN